MTTLLSQLLLEVIFRHTPCSEDREQPRNVLMIIVVDCRPHEACSADEKPQKFILQESAGCIMAVSWLSSVA